MSLSPALQRLRDALTLAEEGREAFSFSLEVKTKSRLNQRGHWTKDSGEHARQRALAARATGKPLGILAHVKAGGRLVVLLTRHAPRQLDSDNLGGALKSIRDGVAESLGVSDAESGPVTWLVDQGTATTKETRVGVRIWLMGDAKASLASTDTQSTTLQGGPFPAVTAVSSHSGMHGHEHGQSVKSAPIVACAFPLPTTLEVVSRVAGEWLEVPNGRPRPADWREQVDEALKATGQERYSPKRDTSYPPEENKPLAKTWPRLDTRETRGEIRTFDWRAMATPNYEKGKP